MFTKSRKSIWIILMSEKESRYESNLFYPFSSAGIDELEIYGCGFDIMFSNLIRSMGNLTLSITTIGDLLLENRITRKKDGKPGDVVKLSIPDYQRPYKWTARNAIQLLDDILEARNANKEVYRVGTLILP